MYLLLQPSPIEISVLEPHPWWRMLKRATEADADTTKVGNEALPDHATAPRGRRSTRARAPAYAVGFGELVRTSRPIWSEGWSVQETEIIAACKRPTGPSRTEISSSDELAASMSLPRHDPRSTHLAGIHVREAFTVGRARFRSLSYSAWTLRYLPPQQISQANSQT